MYHCTLPISGYVSLQSRYFYAYGISRQKDPYICMYYLLLGIGDFHAGIREFCPPPPTHSVLVYIDYSQLGQLRTFENNIRTE